jgi:riboflavin kinase/FMN adenylyltransferase
MLLLGRPHRVRGEVVRGRGLGAEIDAPTANLEVAPFAALPSDGVYAGRTQIDGTVHAAAISVGTPPTFPEAEAALEAHVIGFRGDLYGRTLTLEFVERLREQRRFEHTGDLKAQIRIDIADAARLSGL